MKDAPLIESLLEMGKKVKESKVGETVSYAHGGLPREVGDIAASAREQAVGCL